MRLPVSALLSLSEAVRFVGEATSEKENRVRAALREAGLAGAITATGCLHLSAHLDPARYFAHPALNEREPVPPEDWGTTISWMESRIGRYDLVLLNRADIERWLAAAATNGNEQPREANPLPLDGRESKRKKKPSLNDRKRAAVLGAFEALGREYLSKLLQKEREARVIEKVAAEHNNLSVTDRYVRGLWNSH
jgi:hypothetical protein